LFCGNAQARLDGNGLRLLVFRTKPANGALLLFPYSFRIQTYNALEEFVVGYIRRPTVSVGNRGVFRSRLSLAARLPAAARPTMPRSRKINREIVMASLDKTCPKCGFTITPDP
jgi:hypothetical protein